MTDLEVAYAVTIDIPALPPTVNHMYRSVGGAKRALTDEALTFRQLVALAVRHADAPPPGPLALTIWVTFATKRRQDADNRVKAATDALALALGFDDSVIHEWHVYRRDGKQDGCTLCLEVIL